MHVAGLKRPNRHNIRPLARCDQSAILEPERLGPRQRRRAIGRQWWRAQGDQGADHVIKMPLLGDVERVPVIGAEAHVGRGAFGQQRLQRMQVFRHRPFADQHAHALLQLLARLVGCRRLMLCRNPGGDIGVKVHPAQLRAMPVDMAALKEMQLVHHLRIAVDHTGIVHEFR